MVHSQTESEGGCSLPNSPDYCSTLRATSAGNVAKAIQELNTLTAQTSEKDFFDVSEASFEIILGFIHTSTSLRPDMLSTLSKLLDPVFMCKIFGIRHLIRKLVAAQSRKSPVATCVDVLLAKLYALIGDLVSNAPALSALSPNAKTMLHRKAEENSVRGATQLPDRWTEVPRVLQSSHHSQAAKRIGLTILFGAYIVFPRLGDSSLDAVLETEWSAIWDSLTTSLRQRQPTSVSSAVCHFTEDRLLAAMTVALLAESSLHSNLRPTNVGLRPNELGRILDAVRYIVGNHQAFLLDIDIAQGVLIQWSSFVPWSWSVWQDPRCAGTEMLLPLSLTWFYHLGTIPIASYGPRSRMGEIYTSLLTKSPLHSLKMISVLLHEICFAELWVCTTGVPQLLTLLRNICWATLQLLEHLAGPPNQEPAELTPALIGILQAMVWIFPRVALNEGMKVVAVQQLLIEILAGVERDVAASGLHEIMNESEDDFASAISRVLALCGERSNLRQSATQTLQFLVVLASRCDGVEWLRDLTQTEVKTASDALGREMEECCFTLNTVLVAGCLGLGDFEGLIWSKVGNQSRTDIVTTVNLAEHILSRPVPSDPLVCCDAWDRLRDGLVRIVNRTVPESDESIAVLGSASICDAMRAIIRANQVARAMVSGSPWNVTLAVAVERGIGLSGDDIYAKMLRKMLGNSAKELVREACGLGCASGPIEKDIKNRQVGYLNGQLVVVPSRGLF